MAGGLGRREPTDFTHVDRYPLRALGLPTVRKQVERSMALAKPHRAYYDQGAEGACVGFSSSEMMTILNRRRYDARWLWDQAKLIDEWPETNPGDDQGTSVRAAMDVLRTLGHERVLRGRSLAASTDDGILANRWATTVDEVRTAMAGGTPVVLGVNWYEGFDTPEQVGRDWFIGRGQLGSVRGGHAFVLEAVSDRRGAVRTPNSWGADQPRTWLPYEVLQRLLDESGEAALVSDR